MKIAIVYSRFHYLIVNNLIKGAKKCFNENHIQSKQIKLVEVPGAYEIPLACQKLAQTESYDAIITLGCIIEGQTEHYSVICQATSKGIMEVMLKYNIPIIFEILMVRDIMDAKNRSSLKNWPDNKGYLAAKTALEIIQEFKI